MQTHQIINGALAGRFYCILPQNNQRSTDKILEKFHSITSIIMGHESFFIKITSAVVTFGLVQFDFEDELRRQKKYDEGETEQW